jgi:hypothetical protein
LALLLTLDLPPEKRIWTIAGIRDYRNLLGPKTNEKVIFTNRGFSDCPDAADYECPEEAPRTNLPRRSWQAL